MCSSLLLHIIMHHNHKNRKCSKCSKCSNELYKNTSKPWCIYTI